MPAQNSAATEEAAQNAVGQAVDKSFDPDTALSAVQVMVQGFVQQLPAIGIAVVVFVVFYLIGNVARSMIRRFTQNRQRHKNIGLVAGRLMKGLIIFIGLMIALVIAIPGFTPGQLIQVLGIGSVAIGFAFRDILQNFLAGILLLLDEPFRIGDQIKVDNFEGTVVNIQTRATYILTYDGRRIVIPNGQIFTKAVTVNTARENRRLQYDVGIGYGDDVEKARSLILDVLKDMEGVLDDPAPDVLMVELADSTVNLRVRWWISPPVRAEEMNERDKVLTTIAKTLTQHGIDMPFPTQVMLFHDQTEETDGDRSRQREGWPLNRADNEEPPQPARISEAERKAEDKTKDEDE